MEVKTEHVSLFITLEGLWRSVIIPLNILQKNALRMSWATDLQLSFSFEEQGGLRVRRLAMHMWEDLDVPLSA